MVILMLAGSVRADVTPTERTLARELFEQGRKLMAEKRYPQACAKLAESQRLDPAPGTLLNLAVCHEAEGKTATAWSEFNDALTLARRDGRTDRVELATRRLADLKPRLSRLTIDVPKSARVAELDVKLDGASVGRAVWGSPVPIDPGQHVVEASAPGRKSWRAEISLSDQADRKQVKVPALEPSAERTESGSGANPTPPSVGDAAPPASGSGQRTAGYVIGGIGIAALGVGSYFGVRAFSLWDERDAHCTDAGCDPTGVEAGDDAKQAATIANVGIGVGLAGLAAGAYLVLSAGSSESPSTAAAQPTPDGRGLLLRYRKAF